MVINHCFHDLLDASATNYSLSLPKYKESGLKIVFDDTEVSYIGTKHEKTILPFANSELYEANISAWRRLTSKDDNCKAVYEVVFDVQECNLEFKAGDTIGVIPQNSEDEVNYVIDHLGLQPDARYTLSVDPNVKSAKVPPHIPMQSTLRYVLRHCVDLRCIVKKLFLLALSIHTKDENERRLLEYFCSKEGSVAYTNHILNQNKSLIDIFKIFKSCKPPIEIILANLPKLLPRPYSIVNSGLKNKKEIKICFSVINIDDKRKGLTTGWLENIILNKEHTIENAMQSLSIGTTGSNNNNKVFIYLRKNINNFFLPEDLHTPLILIGPGTGVAPFLGFLEERQFLNKGNSKDIGKVCLFFGCRDPKLDYIYKDELNSYITKGALDQLYVAFSRIENGGIKYVQDSISQQQQKVISLIKDGASIYVCGDHKVMAIQVKESFVSCLVNSGMSRDEAVEFISEMEREKRYVTDVWS